MTLFERFRRQMVPAAVLLAVAASTSAAPKRSVIDEPFFRAHIARLASDEFGGRKPGTDGEARTLEYLESEFRKLGLQPGNGASFRQEVPMVEITAASDAALAFTAGGKVTSLEFRKDMVIWTKRVKT
jgi:hypothetical protein